MELGSVTLKRIGFFCFPIKHVQPSPHKPEPRLVVSHSTCPPLSSSPHAHSFVLGTAVINTHTQTHTVLVAQLVGCLSGDGFCRKGGLRLGSEYAALLAHTGGALYGTELGSVTLKRIGFVCFPIKHSTHTVGTELGSHE